ARVRIPIHLAVDRLGKGPRGRGAAELLDHEHRGRHRAARVRDPSQGSGVRAGAGHGTPHLRAESLFAQGFARQVIRRWALLGALFLIPCGAIVVVETTEARYAEIAREMVATHDFLIPHLDGLPHFDKPPAAYWAMAPGVALLGHNEWGARISVVLAALLTLALTARIAAVVEAQDALATWILAASPLFFILFHLAAADPFVTAAVAGFHAAYLSQRRWLPFVALGLGFLTKGPVAFVPTVLPLVAAAWWTRSWSALRPLASLRGWLIVLVLGLTWYVYIVLRVPGLPSYLLGSEL